MRNWLGAAVLAAIAMGGSVAGAQTYPSRPITLIAPFPAGGPLDVIARIIADPMRETLGQPVVIENLPGAGGNLGTNKVARAEPDGTTIGMGQWSTHVVNPVTYSVPYDIVKDFEPVALIANTPQLIIARKDFPAKDIKELVAGSRPIRTRLRPRRSASRAAPRSRRCISRRRPAPPSASCPIAAADLQ